MNGPSTHHENMEWIVSKVHFYSSQPEYAHGLSNELIQLLPIHKDWPSPTADVCQTDS